MPPMEGTMADRPNILLLLSDEHSPLELGCNGARLVRTPNMAVRCKQTHSTVLWRSPGSHVKAPFPKLCTCCPTPCQDEF